MRLLVYELDSFKLPSLENNNNNKNAFAFKLKLSLSFLENISQTKLQTMFTKRKKYGRLMA